MTRRIPLSEPSFGVEEEELLLECVRTGYVSSVGPMVPAFEEAFAAYVGARHAVACASGTAALHLALLAVGVAPGSDVLVSDLTFIASVNPVTYCGARPVLVDSESRTWNLDGNLVVAELDRRRRAGEPLPSAVVPVHLLGHPADLDALCAACSALGVPVVEDAAEALGGGWRSGLHAGRQVGTIGDAGCFSFNGNKVMTSGGGGMVVTDSDEVAARVRHLSTQARMPGRGSRHDLVGYNYRLTNVAAAVGLAQLGRLQDYLTGRAEVAARYDDALAGLAGVTRPPEEPWARRSNWLYSVLLADTDARDAAIDALEQEGVDARPLWPPVRSQSPYLEAPVLGGAVAPGLAARGLSLPSSAGLAVPDQDRVISVLTRVVEGSAP